MNRADFVEDEEIEQVMNLVPIWTKELKKKEELKLKKREEETKTEKETAIPREFLQELNPVTIIDYTMGKLSIHNTKKSSMKGQEASFVELSEKEKEMMRRLPNKECKKQKKKNPLPHTPTHGTNFPTHLLSLSIST
jgi:hypothetical protein